MQSEAGQNIVAARKWKTVISQFINPMIDHHVINGRVHPSFNQLKIGDFGTITGRFSCSNPNLQQVPKRDKVTAKLYRSIFVADDGMDFYEADYSQCEPRLFAHYSDDEALVEGYNSNPPKDMHSVVAELMDVERDPKAKRMNMGILTGMQKRTFADHMEMPVSEAGPLWEQWYENFTGIKKLQDDCKHTMLKVGYIRTILGRKCRLDSARYAYKGTSRLIQGGNADIMKKKMLDADLMCEESGLAEILLTVHDSVGFQAGKDEKSKDFVQAMLAMMSDVQCEPYNLKVPFVMDVGFGANWSIATFGD
jgi:DNA polymerase-1